MPGGSSREGLTEESCHDGKSNDADDFVDVDDFDCDWVKKCGGDGVKPVIESTDELCSDGEDNDGNGFPDCKDFWCQYTGSVTVCD